MDSIHRPPCFLLLTDLHLSDLPGTAAHSALQWAVATVNQLRPDFLAIAGDATSYGTRPATALFVEAIKQVEVPVCLTPGNAELRDPAGLSLLTPWTAPQKRAFRLGDLAVFLPDTSTGTLPPAERHWLDQAARIHETSRRLVITHYPLDVLDPDSAAWLESWLAAKRVDLLVAGHRHIHRRRRLSHTTEFVCRGLDPDKAIGDRPGLSLFELAADGTWSERFLPWSPALQLLPADLPEGMAPVGWSIQGDPLEAVRETKDFGLSCLELRPRQLDFSRSALRTELSSLRAAGPLYLSYHLPDLRWDADAGRINGVDAVRAGLEVALEAEADHLTMHVPRALASQMLNGDGPSPLYGRFLDLYNELFGDAVRAGVRLALENIHNPIRTPVDSPNLEFATRIDEYLGWLEALDGVLPDAAPNFLGAHFDVGHARNNGGQLDNMQPLGDWYARIGHRILGYHIHQVGPHPDTGKPINHQPLTELFGKRISYAGFLWAWSTHQIARAPLFVEVRQAAGRRQSAALLKRLFDQANDADTNQPTVQPTVQPADATA